MALLIQSILPLFLVGALLAWMAPRVRERDSLRAYPFEVWGLLLLPTGKWQEAVAPVDRSVLQSFRRRMGLGATFAGLATAIGFLLFPTESPNPVEVPITPGIERVPDRQQPIPSPTKPPPVHETNLEVPDVETLRELRTPTRLYGTAKVKPVYRLHDVEGALITRVDPGSFWAMVGVQEGDVVIELHGDPIDDPADLVALMNVLERDEHVAIRVRGQDGEVRYLEHRIPEEQREEWGRQRPDR